MLYVEIPFLFSQTIFSILFQIYTAVFRIQIKELSENGNKYLFGIIFDFLNRRNIWQGVT